MLGVLGGFGGVLLNLWTKGESSQIGGSLQSEDTCLALASDPGYFRDS